jgi:predicted RNA-binding Zn-ribbon protein involved in translation (DUF1610 family)
MIEVYSFSDQPITCPKCGLRTEIITDHIDSPAKTQEHRCPSADCGFEFVVEE